MAAPQPCADTSLPGPQHSLFPAPARLCPPLVTFSTNSIFRCDFIGGLGFVCYCQYGSLGTVSLARCTHPISKSCPVLHLSMELVCFSRNFPLMICKIQPLCRLLALSVTSSSFLMSCPVVFHILFIQLNLRPRPSHLPAAVTRSNWLMAWFACCPTAGAAARVANAWRSLGLHIVKIVEKLCKS